MKLADIAETENNEKGTYAGVHFTPATTESLEKYAKSNKIPKIVDMEKLHTTLLYSRKHLPNYKPAGKYDIPLKGTFDGFDIWKSQPDGKGKTKNCLVMKYMCPMLYQRHHKLMNQHGGTYDFDIYHPHITLSYDVGNLKIDKLPPYEGIIEIADEYGEDLDLDWTANKKVK